MNLNSFFSKTFLKSTIVLIFPFIVFNCSEDATTNLSEYKMEVIESILHEPNLRIANYDQDSNQYLLAYSLDYDLIKFEVRDRNFNLIRSGETKGNYAAAPYTMVMINDSLVFGNSIWDYYKSNENLLLELRSQSDISSNYLRIFNSENTQSTGIFYYPFSDYIRNVGETENYFILSSEIETCFLINKSDFQVTSFKNRFIKNTQPYLKGGFAIAKDELGRPLLSTNFEGVLVFENNEWVPFWNGELNNYSPAYSQLYLASNNYLYGTVDGQIFVFDLNIKKMILKITNTDNINFRYSRIIGEHPDGSIIILTDYLLSNPSNRIFKIKVIKN